MEISSRNKNDLPSKTSEIVKALRGEAVTVAMDIGVEGLLEEGDVQKLITAVNKFAFTYVRAEAKSCTEQGIRRRVCFHDKLENRCSVTLAVEEDGGSSLISWIRSANCQRQYEAISCWMLPDSLETSRT